MDELTPDQLEQLVALGIIPEQQAMLMQQMDQANALRNTPIPKGGMAGRVYVADPLGSLAAGFDRYRGVKQGRAAMDQYSQTLKDQQAARMAYVNALRGAPKPQQPRPDLSPPPDGNYGF